MFYVENKLENLCNKRQLSTDNMFVATYHYIINITYYLLIKLLSA